MTLPGYSHPEALTHFNTSELFDGPVVVQEKIDGSQFSFGLIRGTLECRSRGQMLDMDAPDRLFKAAVDTVKRLWSEGKLVPEWIYRGEVLCKPKHNVLAYDRTPVGNVILFDIDKGGMNYCRPEELRREAFLLGLEVVPTFYEGTVTEPEQLKMFLDNVSCLGGQKIEGYVIKNYAKLDIRSRSTLMGKVVSAAFKEVHAADWKERNPNKLDLIEGLVAKYTSQARWAKAVQHLAEAGTLTNSPRDIGNLIKEVQNDIEKECKDAIVEELWNFAWDKLARGVIKGLPEWYKRDKLGME